MYYTKQTFAENTTMESRGESAFFLQTAKPTNFVSQPVRNYIFDGYEDSILMTAAKMLKKEIFPKNRFGIFYMVSYGNTLFMHLL